MLDLSRPVQTRDGRPARIIANDVKGDTENKVIALVDMGDEEILAIRLANGKLLMDDQESPDDLINVPQTIERYFYLYGTEGRNVASMTEAFGDGVLNVIANAYNDRPIVRVVSDENGNYIGAELVDGKGAL